MNVILKVGAHNGELWKKHMSNIMPEFNFFLANEEIEKRTIEYAIVWQPDPGWLKTFPNLKCIMSIGAGIDHILADTELPTHIPIIKTTNNDLKVRMREYVVLNVLRIHRKLPEIEKAQTSSDWRQIIQPPAHKRSIGIMGLGNLGADCAHALTALGFKVSGWAKSKKNLPNINCFSGEKDKKIFLKQSEIIVCMLPLTTDTRGILNSDLFFSLPKGASLINVGRGQHLVEAHLLHALKEEQISAATLDVFKEEPLPEKHPFWSHPKILVTPHIASLIDPLTGGASIATNLRNFVNGKHITNLVVPGHEY